MTFLRYFTSLFLLCIGSLAHAQQEKIPSTDVPLNQYDEQGKRTGPWWVTTPARMGEPSKSEFGHFDHDLKTGKWYTINEEGDISAIESYKSDVLDGEVKYYYKGILTCSGNYRGFKSQQEVDSIVVIHPDTHEEMLRAIYAEKGTMRHGMWNFYDENSGKLLKEEEYQMDNLIYSKNYVSKEDSLKSQKKAEGLPHKTGKEYKPPRNKRDSYIN